MYYEKFRILCQMRNIRPSVVSKATGISTATLSSWKKGSYTPKQDKLQKIADYFGVTLEYLMDKDDAIYSEDQHLLDLYHSLNDSGKEKVLDYIALLLGNDTYTKGSQNLNVG